MVQIWGKQKPLKQKKTLNTKEAMLVGAQTKSLVSAANTNTKVSCVMESRNSEHAMLVWVQTKNLCQLHNKIVCVTPDPNLEFKQI